MGCGKVWDYLVGQAIRSFWEKVIQHRLGFSRIIMGILELLRIMTVVL